MERVPIPSPFNPQGALVSQHMQRSKLRKIESFENQLKRSWQT
jgi:hypothetical protein